MLLGIDHIVIAVRDLDAAAKDYTTLGFTVVPGGKHPVGTHNVLVAFADGAYIELIAFYRDNPDHRWWAALQRGEGFVDFCMQTDDLIGDTIRLRAAGVKIEDPVPWSRTRPDGYQLKWLLSLARGEHRGVAPFLIQDETPREERIPRETVHRNGALGIGTITVAVADLPQVSHWYRSALGVDGTAVKRPDIEAYGLAFEIGPHKLKFLTPAGKSPLARRLEQNGSSPYAATLRSTAKEKPLFDSRLTHGAMLSFE
jgi:catechol 2,3-dioxygenase-like lactoylglutathione lyase family enzyme